MFRLKPTDYMISVWEDWQSHSENISTPAGMNETVTLSFLPPGCKLWRSYSRHAPSESHLSRDGLPALIHFSFCLFLLCLDLLDSPKVPLKILIWHLKHLNFQDQQHKPEPLHAGSNEHFGSLKAPGNPPDLSVCGGNQQPLVSTEYITICLEPQNITV